MCEHDEIAHAMTGRLIDFVNHVPSIDERFAALHAMFFILRDAYKKVSGKDADMFKATLLETKDNYLTVIITETVEDRQRRFNELMGVMFTKLATLAQDLQEKVLLYALLQLTIAICGFIHTDMETFLEVQDKVPKEQVH